MYRNILEIPVFVGLLLAATGCAEPETHTERAVIEEPVQSLTVQLGSGDVHVIGADVTTVTATARIDGASNHLGRVLTDGKLSFVDDCHENHCSVDITVTVPAGVAVDVFSGSGDLGVEDLLGTIRVHTGSGDILGHGLAGADLGAETGSGDIVLGVEGPAERVHVDTHSGDIALGVPSGSYRLSVATLSGDRDVDNVANDASAPGSIDAFTGSGDVAIRGY